MKGIGGTGIRSTRQKGALNHMWKGDKVSYHTLHRWVTRWNGRPQFCEGCGTEDAKRYEWANISGKYKRELEDWIRLCSSCHGHFDNIYTKSWETRRKNGKDKFYGNQYTI